MSAAWGKGGNGLPKEHNANKPANPHAGHRERLKKRFLKEGLDHFEPHNALELLLFFTNPRGDVNELAHELIPVSYTHLDVYKRQVMGCAVNGPGEAKEADFGVAGGQDCGLLFKKGEVIGKYPEQELLDALLHEILGDRTGE